MQSIIRISRIALVAGAMALAITGCTRTTEPARAPAPAAASVAASPAPAEVPAELAIGPAVESCGGVQCAPKTFCCNPSCGICTPKGVECTQQSCN
jgi:hypothetical protein